MAIWREHPDWKYECFEATTSSDNFVGFENIVGVWRSKFVDGKIPAWADFDFYDFKGWHGFVSISEYLYDPFDLKVRLWGTEMARLYDRDMTGKRLSDLIDSGTDPQTDLEYYAMLGKNMYIGYSTGTLEWIDQSHIHVSFLDLPLSDNKEYATHGIGILLQRARPAI